MRTRRYRRPSRIVVRSYVVQEEAKPDLEHVKIAHLEMIQREISSQSSTVSGIILSMMASLGIFSVIVSSFREASFIVTATYFGITLTLSVLIFSHKMRELSLKDYFDKYLSTGVSVGLSELYVDESHIYKINRNKLIRSILLTVFCSLPVMGTSLVIAEVASRPNYAVSTNIKLMSFFGLNVENLVACQNLDFQKAVNPSMTPEEERRFYCFR